MTYQLQICAVNVYKLVALYVILSDFLLLSIFSFSPEMYTSRKFREVSEEIQPNLFILLNFKDICFILLKQEGAPVPLQPKSEPKILPRDSSFSKPSESFLSSSLQLSWNISVLTALLCFSSSLQNPCRNLCPSRT